MATARSSTALEQLTVPSRVEAVRWSHRQRLRWQTWRSCGRRYAAPIDPLAVIDVPPGAIRHVLPASRRRELEAESPRHVQAVVDGDWDLQTERFLESDRYLATTSHFDAIVDRPAVGDSPGPDSDSAADGSGFRTGTDSREHRSESESAFEERLRALEWYVADVATRGPRRVSERRANRTEPLEESTLVDPYPRLPGPKGEIRVNVGRDGRFILHRGHERLAVAHLLDVDTVPVHVFVRHERWQARRDRLLLTGSDGGEHPDLALLEPRSSVERE